uniref:Uncharacterized protein n=1 Tax=Nelumbo nucifera TaxID=4432 RepID=A0A822YKF5_NELNU|nr:TPA_asm: hypothetical protein HUJ06_011843 [Nelumbo nucifera]
MMMKSCRNTFWKTKPLQVGSTALQGMKLAQKLSLNNFILESDYSQLIRALKCKRTIAAVEIKRDPSES